MENKQIKCPHCKSEEVVKRGSFKTEAHGKQQRYFCKKCNKKFIERTGFYRMRNSPQKITCALDLFYNGVSTRKVQQHFKAFYPHNSSHKSIYKWVIKYSSMISGFTDKLRINAGREVQVDEMEYHRRIKHNKVGVSKDWFIDSIDCKTRFMVGSQYYKSRGKKEIKEVLSRVKYKTEGYIATITTDGLNAYENSIKSIYGYYNLKKGKIKHNKVTAFKGDGFNIMIERLHNSIRERIKIFRGFHGSVESANAIMKGWEIYYNYIRIHQTIKKCPYELAVPELKEIMLNSPNKWISLIELANKNL